MTNNKNDSVQESKKNYELKRRKLMKEILERNPSLSDIIEKSGSNTKVSKEGCKDCGLCEKFFKDNSDDMLGYYEWGCCNECVRKVKAEIQKDPSLVGMNYRKAFKQKKDELQVVFSKD